MSTLIHASMQQYFQIYAWGTTTCTVIYYAQGVCLFYILHVFILNVYCVHTQIGCTITHLQDGWTPLFIACHEGHVSVVEHLIAAKAHINHQDEVNHVLHVCTQCSTTAAQHCCIHCFAMTVAIIT